MKKVFIMLTISAFLGSSLFAKGECQHYGKAAEHYIKIASNAKNPCAKADALEQVINNLDSARKSCSGGEELKPLIIEFSGYLFKAVQKCGH